MSERLFPSCAFAALCGGLLLCAPVAWGAAAGQRDQNVGAAKPAVRCADEGQWKRVPGGSRPAYAGIQGGTVPVSLLQASNGTIFVVPGRTGNDFTHVLRGTNGTPENTAQAAKPAPQPETPPQAAQAAPQVGETASAAPETAPAQAAAKPAAPAPAQPAPQTPAQAQQEDHVVFASAELAARLNETQELAPFGLTEDASEVAPQDRAAHLRAPARAAFKPLRLGSYQTVLSKI